MISFSLFSFLPRKIQWSQWMARSIQMGQWGSFDSRLMRLGAKEKSKKQRDLAAFLDWKNRKKNKQTAGPIDKENTRGNRFLMRRGSFSLSLARCFCLFLSVWKDRVLFKWNHWMSDWLVILSPLLILIVFFRPQRRQIKEIKWKKKKIQAKDDDNNRHPKKEGGIYEEENQFFIFIFFNFFPRLDEETHSTGREILRWQSQ